jgi:hypothetical protein
MAIVFLKIQLYLYYITYYTPIESPSKVIWKKYFNFFTKACLHLKKSKKHFLKILKFPKNKYLLFWTIFKRIGIFHILPIRWSRKKLISIFKTKKTFNSRLNAFFLIFLLFINTSGILIKKNISPENIYFLAVIGC